MSLIPSCLALVIASTIKVRIDIFLNCLLLTFIHFTKASSSSWYLILGPLLTGLVSTSPFLLFRLIIPLSVLKGTPVIRHISFLP